MIERVTRAIFLRRHNKVRVALGHDPLPDDIAIEERGVNWADAVEAAQAALSAITPPNGDEVREALAGNVVELKTARGYIAVEDCDLELWDRLQEAQAVNGPVISIIAEFRETVAALAKEKRG